MSRKIGNAGLSLIRSFEGCRLTAYQDSVKVWTIGYGHTGADVFRGLKITQAKADALLSADCQKFANAVDVLGLSLNDNQRDALISFAFNCGAGNLKTLCKGRTITQIAEHIMAYNKAGGKVLAGLTRRRAAELKLYNSSSAPISKVACTDYAPRNSAYSLSNGIHIMKIPVADFRVQHWNKAKKTTEIRNYANGGFFNKDAGAKTLPVGNLKADVYPENFVKDEKYYYLTTHEHGYIEDGKLIVETKNTKQKEIAGKKVSTLFLYNNGVPQIEATDFVPNDCKYAISGAPVMMKGKDCSWNNDVLAQGWDGSIAYATWHGFLGLKGDGYIYYIGMKTSSGNLWTSSEAYNKLKTLGFRDVIKIDGGGSYIMDVDGTNKAATSENRVINNVVRFL